MRRKQVYDEFKSFFVYDKRQIVYGVCFLYFMRKSGRMKHRTDSNAIKPKTKYGYTPFTPIFTPNLIFTFTKQMGMV